MNPIRTRALASTLLFSLLGLAGCRGGSLESLLPGQGGGDGGNPGDPTVFFSIGDVVLPEGDQGVTSFVFPVTLSASVEQIGRVSFRTLAGTAAATGPEADFVPQTGELTFEPGTTQVLVAIAVNGDTVSELDETFSVELFGPQGELLGIGDALGTATIVDDDGYQVSISDLTELECDFVNKNFEFEITLSKPHTEAVRVGYVTADGTALHGLPGDFIWRRDVVQFEPGETSKTAVVRVLGDTVAEPDEFFTVHLYAVEGPDVSILKGTSVISIIDDDTELEVDRGPVGSDATAPQLAGVGPNLYAVWQDDRDGASNVYFNRSIDGGIDWRPTDVRLDRGPLGAGGARAPRISASGAHVYAVWEDTRNGKSDVYFNCSADHGQTWLATDVRLDTDFPGEGRSERPRIASSGEGVYVVWTDWRRGRPEVRFNASLDGGATWRSEDLRLSDGEPFGAPAYAAELHAEGPRLHVVWLDERNGAAEVYHDTSADGGLSWLAHDNRVGGGPGDGGCAGVQLCAEGPRVFVVWEDSRSGDADIYFNRSLDDGATWLPFDRRIDNGGSGAGDSTSPRILSQGQTVMVVWQNVRPGLHEDVFFSSSPDAGATWRGNVRVDRGDEDGATRGVEPALAFDGDRIVVAWQDDRNGAGMDVYLGWSTDGGSTFTDDFVRVDQDDPGAADSRHPELLCVGSSFHVLWQDDRDGDDVLFRTFCLP